MKTAVKYRIEMDTHAESPDTWGDEGLFLVANHRNFYVPEPRERTIPDSASTIVDRWKKTHWVFPIEAYIHSGVHLSLAVEGNYPDRQWDVSQLGFVFAAKKEWRLSESARKVARSYLETWNQYLSGDVWGYIIEDEDGTHIDSCWGFYGKEYCEAEAKHALVYLSE